MDSIICYVLILDCGGAYNSSTTSLPVSIQISERGVSRNNPIHCVWYFELSKLQILTLALSQSSFLFGGRCLYYRDFLQLQSWNETNGKIFREDIIRCRYTEVPRIKSLRESKRFTIRMHSYSSLYQKNVYGVYFLSSKGKDQFFTLKICHKKLK